LSEELVHFFNKDVMIKEVYHTGKKLGKGKNSSIRLGVHCDLNLVVAIKITKREKLNEKEMYEALREADILN